MSRALAWLEGFNAKQEPAGRLLPAVLFLKASALALRQAPQLNGTLVDGAFVPGEGVHIGWAVSLRGGGLIAPAIRDVDLKSLVEAMAAMRDVIQRARSGGLRSSELSSATITVTSLGDRGAEAAQGIIYPPQVAIVGFGRVALRPWVVDGRVEARPIVTANSRRRPPRHRRSHRRALSRGVAQHLAEAGGAMTEKEIKALFAELIGGIAPEADLSTLGDDEDMREALDLDSMDFNNLIIALHKRTGIDVPESDYNKLFTMRGAVAYLAKK